MRKSLKDRFTSRAAMLLLACVALAASTTLLIPADVSAIPLCGYSFVWTYYEDPGLTVYAGTCFLACDGYQNCWGNTSTCYYTTDRYECTEC